MIIWKTASLMNRLAQNNRELERSPMTAARNVNISCFTLAVCLEMCALRRRVYEQTKNTEENGIRSDGWRKSVFLQRKTTISIRLVHSLEMKTLFLHCSLGLRATQ